MLTPPLSDATTRSRPPHEIQPTGWDQLIQGILHRPSSIPQVQKTIRIHHRYESMLPFFRVYMICIALLGPMLVFLQAERMIHYESSENYSLVAYLVYVWAALSWIAYGLLWSDSIIILAGVVSLVGGILCTILIFVYAENKLPHSFVL